MLRLLLLQLIFLSFHMPSLAQGSVDSREAALASLRNFRHELKQQNAKMQSDTLMGKVVKVINFVKTVDNVEELNAIQSYFANASEALVGVDSLQQTRVVSAINLDLGLKLDYYAKAVQLNFESFETFKNDADFKVQAIVNGKKQAGNFRLYWANYRAGALETLIRTNSYSGHSNAFENPFSITLSVPGYFTFWLIDTDNSQVYRPDQDYYIMDEEKDHLDINFLTFKKNK